VSVTTVLAVRSPRVAHTSLGSCSQTPRPSLPPSLPPSLTHLYRFRSSASVPTVRSPRVAHMSLRSCSVAVSTPSRE